MESKLQGGGGVVVDGGGGQALRLTQVPFCDCDRICPFTQQHFVVIARHRTPSLLQKSSHRSHCLYISPAGHVIVFDAERERTFVYSNSMRRKKIMVTL